MVPKFYLYLCVCFFALTACSSGGPNSAQHVTTTSKAAPAPPQAAQGAEMPVATETLDSVPSAAINDTTQTIVPPVPQETAARAKDQTPKKKADACELITKSEIKSVQGADVGQAKGSERASGPFILSQCYYTVVPFNKSVSLEVTRGGAKTPAGKGVEPFWQQRFREAKPTKGADVPQRVAAVGEDAYWVGNDLIGSLYVKQGDQIVRISVGGKESIEEKRKKSVALARKALSRL